ncbi:hypothetical protein CsSME_00043364 [Camellia sinensis var. sinensis]
MVSLFPFSTRVMVFSTPFSSFQLHNVLHDKTSKAIMYKGVSSQGLYRLLAALPLSLPRQACFRTTTTSSPDIWHSRLGHPSTYKFRVLCNKFQLSVPSNKTSIRKHHHVVEIAVALLHQSSIPLTYWFEAIATSVFLINRMPSSKSVSSSQAVSRSMSAQSASVPYIAPTFVVAQPISATPAISPIPAGPVQSSSVSLNFARSASLPPPSLAPIPAPSLCVDLSSYSLPISLVPPLNSTSANVHPMTTRSKAASLAAPLSFAVVSSDLLEPSTFKADSLSPAWSAAMDPLVSLPFGKQSIGCKWVYRLKKIQMVLWLDIRLVCGLLNKWIFLTPSFMEF